MRSTYIALVVCILALPGLLLFGACSAPGSGGQPKAAIVDQLYSLHPNPAFIHEMARLLEGCGFKVDLHQGKQIDVKFYRKLPDKGYRIIILRAHAGLLAQSENPDVMAKKTTFLFTDEAYSKRKYVVEQLGDQMVPAEMTKDYPRVFAINSKFIVESMDGTFDRTVVIAMGCSTLALEDMAAAFSIKGASAFMGWDRFVGIDYVDEAVIYLVQKLCVDNLTVAAAVAATIAEKGRDPYYGAILKYYPPQSGDKTLKQLVTAE